MLFYLASNMYYIFFFVEPIRIQSENIKVTMVITKINDGILPRSLDSTRKLSRVLKQIKMDITDSETCQNELRTATRPRSNKHVLGHRFNLHRSFLCAGGGSNQDTCTGDGGSPLVCPAKGRESGKERYFQAS